MSEEDLEVEEEQELEEGPIDTEELQEESVDTEEKREEVSEEEEPTRKELREEVDELESSLKKVMADFDNYKKRMIKEKQRIRQLANEDLMMDLLEVLDDFERAIDNEDEIDEDGIEMIFDKFIKTLQDHGLERIEAEGEEFDPMYHDCVQSVESDEAEKDQIIEVFQEGYKLNDEVIRPSKVKVAK